jgi:hypothetical protein
MILDRTVFVLFVARKKKSFCLQSEIVEWVYFLNVKAIAKFSTKINLQY